MTIKEFIPLQLTTHHTCQVHYMSCVHDHLLFTSVRLCVPMVVRDYTNLDQCGPLYSSDTLYIMYHIIIVLICNCICILLLLY